MLWQGSWELCLVPYLMVCVVWGSVQPLWLLCVLIWVQLLLCGCTSGL